MTKQKSFGQREIHWQKRNPLTIAKLFGQREVLRPKDNLRPQLSPMVKGKSFCQREILWSKGDPLTTV